jgi:hypothetical protein
VANVQVVKKLYVAQTLLAAKCSGDPELETAEDLLSRALYELLGRESFRGLMNGVITATLMNLSLDDTLALVENLSLLCANKTDSG